MSTELEQLRAAVDGHLRAMDVAAAQIALLATQVAALTETVRVQQKSIDTLVAWQTWGIRLILGLVVAGVLLAVGRWPAA